MWKLIQGYLCYTRKHQKTSPWCNSKLRFMEYFLNSLRNLSLLLKGETMIDCMSTGVGHANCHELWSVSFGLALCGSSDRMNGYLGWIVPLIPDHRPYQLTDPMKWWCIMTKVFSSHLCYSSLSLSLSAKIKALSTGSSQLSPLCYLSAKSKSRFKVQHVVKRPTWRRDRHMMRLRALQSQNPQVWCSFAKCKDKMDLWVTDSRLLVTENIWDAGPH